MAKLDEVRSKRAGETGSRDTVLGVAGMLTFDPLLQASNRMLEGWMAVGSEDIRIRQEPLRPRP